MGLNMPSSLWPTLWRWTVGRSWRSITVSRRGGWRWSWGSWEGDCVSPIATAEKGVSLLETEWGLQGFLNIPKFKNNKLSSRLRRYLLLAHGCFLPGLLVPALSSANPGTCPSAPHLIIVLMKRLIVSDHVIFQPLNRWSCNHPPIVEYFKLGLIFWITLWYTTA